MKIIAASLAITLLPISAFAQTAPSVTEIATESIQNTVETDTAAAVAALEAGDYAKATSLLRAASANANRLSLKSITEEISSVTPSFKDENSRFALTGSSTLEFENFISASSAYERLFKDDRGRVVTVRVFGEDDDLKDFMFIASDTKMLEKGNIEVAEMRGEQALKNRKDDGSLSVIMMSEADHALIEVEGPDEEAVMAFIGELEAAD